MRNRLVSALVFFSLQPSMTLAQQEPPPAEMQQLQFLVGRWQGHGWRIGADGERQVFQQTEIVESRANGAALSIEGTGRNDDPSRTGSTVFSAFGVVSYDRNQQTFRWYAVTGTGDQIDTGADVAERRLIWKIAIAGAPTTRYTIQLDEHGRWFEIGETSSDGCVWQKFFEMTLDRSP